MIRYFQYSFYSKTKRAFAQVKATKKTNVAVYAKNVLHEDICLSDISQIKTKNGEQSPIELSYPEIFK